MHKSVYNADFYSGLMMKISVIPMCLSLCVLSACTWEFAPDKHGKTQIRQKYPAGTSVYYTNGAASQNTHYHELRPQPHAILPQ